MSFLFGLLVSGALVPAAQQALPGREAPDVLDAVLSEVERRIICEYYGEESPACAGADPAPEKRKDRAGGKKKDGLPPGLARRSSLPPGLQRQLDEKGRLPPGLEKRALPADLASRLPPREDGAEIVIVDRDVLLIRAATGLVLDAIAGVVR